MCYCPSSKLRPPKKVHVCTIRYPCSHRLLHAWYLIWALPLILVFYLLVNYVTKVLLSTASTLDVLGYLYYLGIQGVILHGCRYVLSSYLQW